MEERDVIKSSIQNKMEYFNRYCKIGNIVLLNNEAECNQWPMARWKQTRMTREMF